MPEYPVIQVHVYEFIPSIQLPPCSQGLLRQSLISARKDHVSSIQFFQYMLYLINTFTILDHREESAYISTRRDYYHPFWERLVSYQNRFISSIHVLRDSKQSAAISTTLEGQNLPAIVLR